MGRALIAPWSSEAMTSGQMLSASSGTPSTGCFSVSVIMASGLWHAGNGLRVLQPRHLGRIVLEGQRVQLLERRTDEILDRRIELGLHQEDAPFSERPDLPFLDDDLAALQHVSRMREHHAIAVGFLGVDGDVAVCAQTEMSLLLQPERARRTR